MNWRRSHAEITWYDYVESMQNLERYTINFFYLVRNLGRPNNHMQYGKNEIEIE